MKSRMYHNNTTETQEVSSEHKASMTTEMEHIQLEYSVSQCVAAYTQSNCDHFENLMCTTYFKLILIKVNSN
jgi:hypothetical protein